MGRFRSSLVAAAVPLAALVALGGAYSSSVLPLLVAAGAAFIVAASPVATSGSRIQDGALIAFLLGLGLQIAPMPAWMVDALSPHARSIAALLSVAPSDAGATLSIRPALTRETLFSAATVVLVYWTARGLLAGGGARWLARTFAVAGLITAFAGLAQRATASRTLLWMWVPEDPGGRPMGPFVNRNHFAMWLVMAGALAAGALATHLAHRAPALASDTRLRLVGWAQDGTAQWLAGAAVLMWLTVFASGSRGALVALAVFGAVWLMLASRQGHSLRKTALAGGALTLVAVIGVSANLDMIVSRLDGGPGIPRSTVWKDTLPVASDFAVAGTGGGTYANAMLLYQRNARVFLFNEAQNEYLQVITEGGVLLSLPLLVWFGAWIATAARRLREDRSSIVWLRVAALAGLSAVAVQCIWDSALRMPANAMLAALLAAVAVHIRPAPAPVATPDREGRRRTHVASRESWQVDTRAGSWREG